MQKEKNGLTSNVEVVYIPTLYDICGREVKTGERCDNKDIAIEKGKDMVKDFVDIFGIWCYAKIEQRIVPMYKRENENESL